MGEVSIQVTQVGKRYRLGRQPARGLRDLMRQGLGRLRDSFSHGEREDDFWALRDISFELRRGEVVGVIGRNGAGKSTLLKLLSRITPPTTGRMVLEGRVSSLLEVGTGFHPELSGRDNIFLNGAILGMRRTEIRARFDEIVAFAEVERFIDTPVKHYSSGMYVRLAFAVAAHLEPEILIIDEVLAVGDAQFQQKCLGKIRYLTGGGGRTVLFVSHNTASILSLCNRCLLLRGGRLAADGSPGDVIASYLEGHGQAGTVDDPTRTCVPSLEVSHDPQSAQLVVETRIHSPEARRVSLELIVLDHLRQPVAFGEQGSFFRDGRIELPAGLSRFRLRLAADRLAKGSYSVRLQVMDPASGLLASAESGHACSLAPLAAEGQVLVLDQQWGNGSVWLPLQVERQ